MKVMIVNEVMTGDVSPVAMFSYIGTFDIFGHGRNGLCWPWYAAQTRGHL